MELWFNPRRFTCGIDAEADENNKKKVQEERKSAKKYSKSRQFMTSEASSLDLIANYSKADLFKKSKNELKDGVSEFRYGDARYTVYKRGDKYKSEFFAPHGFDRGEFFKHFEELKPVEKQIEKTSSSTTALVDVNGEIDGQYVQGDTGDCWLLTALTSLSSSEAGKEIISNSITVNDDNTVTVTFRGIGVSYTITADEIARYDTDSNTSDKYSNGDNDVLVMELAVEKLWKDINRGKVTLDSNNEDITFTGNSIDEGGLPIQLIYYLTGSEAKEYYNEDLTDLSKSTIYSVLQEALDKGNTALNFGIYYNEHSAKLIDGSTYSLDVGDGGHALAITNITSNTVTFINPWDSNIEYTMSWSEFASLGIGYISSADLTNTNYKSEITDMSGNSSSNNNYYNDYEYEFNDNYGKFDDFTPFEPNPFDDYNSQPQPQPHIEPDDDYGSNGYDYRGYNDFSFTDFLYAFMDFFFGFFAKRGY